MRSARRERTNQSGAKYQQGLNWLTHVAGRIGARTREHGVGYVVRYAKRTLREHVTAPIEYVLQRSQPRRTFRLAGHTYTYFLGYHNYTWRNERAVELPVVLALLAAYSGRRVLEVGNVLSHYRAVEHTVVDKFERAPGVINVDVVEYRPEVLFDCVVSISTLEHVGWDEYPRDPEKPRRAVKHMRSLLAPGGVLLLTFPVGYSAYLDDALRSGRLPFTRILCMRRVSGRNDWREASWEEIADARYNDPFPAANGLVIAELRNE